jgi:hypothetical protein
VGYIAQQIESVVPSAVQLIDGILHVDYESLIPYLSEAIKQNFEDIKHANSEQERIKVIVDMLYEDFLTRERKEKVKHTEHATSHSESRPRKNKVLTRVIAAVGTIMLVSAIILGLYLLLVPEEHKNLQNEDPTDSDVGQDRKALEELFMATNGGSWDLPGTQAIRWLSTAPLCSWNGIDCKFGRVTAIVLPGANLRGTIPESLGTLDVLESLDLGMNNLTGTLPSSLSSLKNLRQLWIHLNPLLSGTIPELPSGLYQIRLQGCNLTGTIPKSISDMKYLFTLQLNDNQLSGTIPPLPCSKYALMADFSLNRLEGSLPKISPLNNIAQLNVSHNTLSGTLENLVGGTIGSISIEGNQFSGEVSYFYTQAARSFYIHDNRFTSFNSSVSAPISLLQCNASHNPFKCPIPDWLAQRCNATCIS